MGLIIFNINIKVFQEDERMMSSREITSSVFGVQMLESSNVRKRKRRHMGPWDPARIWCEN